MGWFSSSPAIYWEKIDKYLRQISIIDPAEREYIKGVFTKYRHGGIDKWEIEKAIRELKFNTSDNIDPAEAERVRKELLSHL